MLTLCWEEPFCLKENHRYHGAGWMMSTPSSGALLQFQKMVGFVVFRYDYTPSSSFHKDTKKWLVFTVFTYILHRHFWKTSIQPEHKWFVQKSMQSISSSELICLQIWKPLRHLRKTKWSHPTWCFGVFRMGYTGYTEMKWLVMDFLV